MPPLPDTFEAEISDLLSVARRRQTDLVEFQIPRLRSCKSSLSLQQNLAAELREDIDSFARQVEVRDLPKRNTGCSRPYKALDICVGDQRGKNRVELRQIVDSLQDALTQYG